MTTRIAKYLSECGIASRRDAEKMIADGRVSVNGVVIDTPVYFVAQGDRVCVDGNVVHAREQTVVYMFHKPINCLTTQRDDSGRKTIYDFLPPEYRNLKYIGRLDYKTTGLLLLTNDGELARNLTLPSSGIPRTYIATISGKDSHSGLERARRGITVDGIKYQPMQIEELSDTKLRITISEGKKNEIRIVLRACGCPVRRLHRISYGNIQMGKLPVGKIEKIMQKTIDEMTKTNYHSN